MLSMRQGRAIPVRVAKPVNRFIGPPSRPPQMGISSFGTVTSRGQVATNQRPNPEGIPWTPNTNLRRRVSPIHTPPSWTMTRHTPVYAKPNVDWLSPKVTVTSMQTPESSVLSGAGGGFAGAGGFSGGGGGSTGGGKRLR